VDVHTPPYQQNILIESISDERTSDSGVPARATYRVDATVAGDSPDEKPV
jgi:hypothetical protein